MSVAVTDQNNHSGLAIASTILALAEARGPQGSISPSDVAQVLAPTAWRPLLGAVRRSAAGLAAAGRIEILRKGKPIDPAELRGVIRLRIRPDGGGIAP
jgi:Protein of unknown function (DUF3253)